MTSPYEPHAPSDQDILDEEYAEYMHECDLARRDAELESEGGCDSPFATTGPAFTETPESAAFAACFTDETQCEDYYTPAHEDCGYFGYAGLTED